MRKELKTKTKHNIVGNIAMSLFPTSFLYKWNIDYWIVSALTLFQVYYQEWEFAVSKGLKHDWEIVSSSWIFKN